jgi:hypothetical protein
MIQQGRMTKQGLRDLNSHGPRRSKDAAGDPPAAAVADAEVAADPGSPVPLAVEADEGRTAE